VFAYPFLPERIDTHRFMRKIVGVSDFEKLWVSPVQANTANATCFSWQEAILAF
jgi:hypothetical protein